MQPLKHLEQMKNLERKRSRNRKLIGLIAFVASAFALGPLLHEISHIVLLEAIDCGYSTGWGFNLKGAFASVKPLCAPSPYQLVSFYSVGLLNTLIAGGVFSLYSIGKDELSGSRRVLYAGIGTGFLVSTLLALSTKGDIENLVKTLQVDPFYGIIIALLLYVGCSAAILRSLEILWDSSEGE